MGVTVRIGNRSAQGGFTTLQVSGTKDTTTFQDMVIDAVRSNPDEPLVLIANAYESYLEEVYASCFNFHQCSPAMLNREVHLSDSVQLPTSPNRRAAQVPWSFIIDQMNLPEVWHWTFGHHSLPQDRASSIQNYRFRVGAWVCDQGAYRLSSRTTVVLLYTRSDYISEDIVNHLLFPHLSHAAQLYDDQTADDAVCWVFYLLYNLLTNWQNIVSEVGRKLNQAELDSHLRDLPVKVRTRRLHKEVDRTYELHDYLRFHSRAFKKLAKFKRNEATVNKHGNSIWEVIDDCLEDLEQYENYLDSMKERFNNLIELDFNVENATQSSDARFISILGAIFLPISFVAGIFGMNAINWSPVYYLYISLPLFTVSMLACLLIPPLLSRREAARHPTHLKRIQLRPDDVTMLGAEAPEGADTARRATIASVLSSPAPKHPTYHTRSVSRPPTPKPKLESRPSFGLQRSPGLVGSRRKQLHDEDTRREVMHFRDFQREVERSGGATPPTLTVPTRPGIHVRAASAVVVPRGRPAGNRALTDTFLQVGHERSDDPQDVERQGGRRRVSRSDV